MAPGERGVADLARRRSTGTVSKVVAAGLSTSLAVVLVAAMAEAARQPDDDPTLEPVAQAPVDVGAAPVAAVPTPAAPTAPATEPVPAAPVAVPTVVLAIPAPAAPPPQPVPVAAPAAPAPARAASAAPAGAGSSSGAGAGPRPGACTRSGHPHEGVGLMRAVRRVCFRAMGSAAEVAVVGGPDGLAERGRALVDTLEDRWSRFRPASELNRINHAGGRPVAVHAHTVRLVQAMVAGWHLTAGAYDPTLLVPLVGLGYASSRCDPSATTVLPEGAARAGRPDEVLVDERAGVVVVPTGTVLDPGGVGKGLAADVVVEELLAAGAEGVLVELGGDLRVAGSAPRPEGWLVAVGDGGGTPVLRLADGGVATSGTGRTRWLHEHREVHHVLDPGTGTPVGEGPDDAVEVTVAARSAAWAEVLATAALVRGLAWTRTELDRLDLAGLVRTGDGVAHPVGRWSDLQSGATGEEAA